MDQIAEHKIDRRTPLLEITHEISLFILGQNTDANTQLKNTVLDIEVSLSNESNQSLTNIHSVLNKSLGFSQKDFLHSLMAKIFLRGLNEWKQQVANENGVCVLKVRGALIEKLRPHLNSQSMSYITKEIETNLEGFPIECQQCVKLGNKVTLCDNIGHA